MPSMTSATRFLSALLSFTSLSSLVLAAPLTLPPGLLPGDRYRLAFITSGITPAISTDISYYNSLVQSEANGVAELASLSSTWRVLGSTATVNARDNTGTNPSSDGVGVPIYLLNGAPLALGNEDLWDGEIANWLNVLPSGDPLTFDPNGLAVLAHTGTLSDGIAAPGGGLPGALGSPGAFDHVFGGNPFITNHNWIEGAGSNKSLELPLYALSGVLTVPEPRDGIQLLLGAVAFVLGWQRARQFTAGG